MKSQIKSNLISKSREGLESKLGDHQTKRATGASTKLKANFDAQIKGTIMTGDHKYKKKWKGANDIPHLGDNDYD